MVSRAILLWSAGAHAGLIATALVCGVAVPSRTFSPIAIELRQTEASAVFEATEPDMAAEPPMVDQAIPEPVLTEPEVTECLPVFEPPAAPLVEVPEDRQRPTLSASSWAKRVVAAPSPQPAAAEPPPAPPPVEPSVRVLEVVPGVNRPPAYPRDARARGWQGTVLLQVTVDASGHVVHCRIATSSGYASLDDAAAQAVRAWHFRGGPGDAIVPVEFVLR